MSDLILPRFLSIGPAGSRTDAGGLVGSLRLMLRTYLTRRALRDLTARELADIGLTFSTAVAEAARLPWDMAPPPHRHARGMIGAFQRGLVRVRTRRLAAWRETARPLKQ